MDAKEYVGMLREVAAEVRDGVVALHSKGWQANALRNLADAIEKGDGLAEKVLCIMDKSRTRINDENWNKVRALCESAITLAAQPRPITPFVRRATGRTIADLTKIEHVCEWQNDVHPASQVTPGYVEAAKLMVYVKYIEKRLRAWDDSGSVVFQGFPIKHTETFADLDCISKISQSASPLPNVSAKLAAAEQMAEALENYAGCSEDCTCGDGWSHRPAKAALAAYREANKQEAKP